MKSTVKSIRPAKAQKTGCSITGEHKKTPFFIGGFQEYQTSLYGSIKDRISRVSPQAIEAAESEFIGKSLISWFQMHP